jgi:hypothetical protein
VERRRGGQGAAGEWVGLKGRSWKEWGGKGRTVEEGEAMEEGGRGRALLRRGQRGRGQWKGGGGKRR